MDSVLPHVCISKRGIYSSVLITHTPPPRHPLYSHPSLNPACLLMMQAVYLTITLELLPTKEKKKKKIGLKRVVFPQLERLKLSTAFIMITN